MMFWPSIQISPESGSIKPTRCFKKHALPAAAATDDDQRLSFRDIQIDPAQNFLLPMLL